MTTFLKLNRALSAVVLVLLAAAPAYASDADAAALRAAVSVERARAPAARYDRSAFLIRPAIRGVSLSPDGRHVAYLREQGRSRSVWLLPTAGGAPQRLLSQTEAERTSWSRDGRWLLLESPRQLFVVAAAGQPGSGIVSTLGGRDRREVQAIDPVHPAAVLLQERLRAPGSTERWRLVRVDMRGKRTLLREDRHEIAGFAFDADGRLAFLERVEGEDLVIHRVDATGNLHEVLRCVRMERCAPLPVTNADGELLLRGDHGGDRSTLSRLDAQGALHMLHADPRGEADLGELVLDPVTRQPLIASYRSTVATNYGLTADAQRHVETIARRLPQRNLGIEIGRGADARWLVDERSPLLQGERWHIYDPRTGALRGILGDPPLQQRTNKPVPWLPEQALARKIPFAYRASDGMRLHGFLSLPPGADPAKVPLVSAPHGGPWNASGPAYGSFAQLLVNRGYAVFEPNFRGSTGYGRDYMFAARGDFGNGRVQQDIVDGTRYLLAQGIGDPQRVGMVGASFGGYSTLLGVTFAPDLFKVGVAIVPPPDFGWDLRWVARSNEALNLARYIPFEAMLRVLSLDMDDDAVMARLRAQSPLSNAGRLRRPLLLIASGEDRRVAIHGVIEYAAQLKLQGKDASLLVDPEAGHSNEDPLGKEAMLYLIERMLHRHLGGVAPKPADPALRAYLIRNLRLRGNDFKDLSAATGDGSVGLPRQRVQDARILGVERIGLGAAEMAVEGAHGGRPVVDGITDQAQRQPRIETRRRLARVGGRPATEARVRQLFPREAHAGIAFAHRREIGVRDDLRTRYVQSLAEIVEQFQQAGDLFRRERRFAVVVEFDADRRRIDVGDRAPMARSRMPGAFVVGDQLEQCAIAPDQVVRADRSAAVARTQRVQAFLHAVLLGRVDHDQDRPACPVVV